MNSDFHAFSEHIKAMASVFSVEVFPDGSYGNIRLVTGNNIFFQTTKDNQSKIGDEGIYNTDFIPNQPYYHYIPKDKNFEEFCYNSAILGKTLHTYIRPERMPIWIHLTAIPLQSDKPNIGYCAYVQSFSEMPDYELMTNIAPDIASNVLEICMKLRGANNFTAAINDIISDIRNICNAEHCCILSTDFNQRKCSVLCEALSEKTELPLMKSLIDDDFFAVVDTWHETIAGSTCAFVKDKQDWENLRNRNPVWYKSIKSSGIDNIILFPLRYRNQILGFIWATNFDVENALKIKETLELTTYFLSSELASHQLFNRLEVLSSQDVLTGVMNRNAMNNRIDSFIANNAKSEESVGIVFADLNGLKHVNDNDGHFAGDLLLKDAALSLQKHFPEYEIYRAGGDEFMVLALEPDKDTFIKKVERFKSDTAAPDTVCFATGWSYGTLGAIRKALQTADSNMYADKEEFYKKHPERKR
ncbi:GGDEF domain-containing protein [Ruminococcus flavefaciens]|uniref:Diguanylate cyclase (GGDEF) domain-containing protein n=1 Tax=Ruminococcus flavefaciens TaxID=1265 RepID=A0A1M7M911_RUMFL|nr:GGDEF domain-containing protein [Ruminococcus flavefaciens]SHM87231.1 diguanylate cyclase (GGDEF) domain-containing protein [Ruminococcus flavefaciens]